MSTEPQELEHEHQQHENPRHHRGHPNHQGHQHVSLLSALEGQPRAVWVVAFAAVIAFMGIGLVDPILLSIASGLHATPSQTTLLFASYLGVQVLAMLVTGLAAQRFGGKRTMIVGLALIVVFAGLCATASSIGELVALRAFWGMGNAFFIATALSTIVAAASGGQTAAILLYEAALGLGISAGPLVGAALGSVSWRGPFLGTSVLMFVGLILVATLLRRDPPAPATERRSWTAPFRALRHGRLFGVALASMLYTYAFFTLLAWTPFVLQYGPFAVGGIFFGWGILVAVCGVVLAPRLAAKIGERRGVLLALTLYALLLLAFVWGSKPVIVVATILSGIASGCLNTYLTDLAMKVSDAPRPIASAGYNFLRWLGGAAAAILVGHIADWAGSDRIPFLVACLTCVGAVIVTFRNREPDPHKVAATSVVAGEEIS